MHQSQKRTVIRPQTKRIPCFVCFHLLDANFELFSLPIPSHGFSLPFQQKHIPRVCFWRMTFPNLPSKSPLPNALTPPLPPPAPGPRGGPAAASWSRTWSTRGRPPPTSTASQAPPSRCAPHGAPWGLKRNCPTAFVVRKPKLEITEYIAGHHRL